jgi:hypothetical protein
LCHGAILPVDEFEITSASHVVAPLDLISVDAQGSSGIDSACVVGAGSWPTPPPGRTIRLQIESLQV